jgi:hypothetical protein
MTKLHERVTERLDWDCQMDLHSLEFQDLWDKVSEVEGLLVEETFKTSQYQKFIKDWVGKARAILAFKVLDKYETEIKEKANEPPEKGNDSVQKGDGTQKKEKLANQSGSLESNHPKVIPRNTLTPESYSRMRYDNGGSDADESEASGTDDNNRNKDREGSEGSDSDWISAGNRKTLKRKHRRRAGETESSADEGQDKDNEDDLPVATYERKFTHGGELMADSWANSNLSDAEHCSVFAAMASSAKLQSIRSKFMKTVRYLIMDGVIVCPESFKEQSGFDQSQIKSIQEVVGLTIPTGLVDMLVEFMDGSVFGASQFEQFQQKLDKWFKENVKLSQPTTNRVLKLTMEGYLQSIGQFQTEMTNIRWKSVEELKNGSSKASGKGASDTKNTIEKWSNSGSKASSSSSSSSAIPKKQLSKDMNSTTPSCLLGTPMAGNLHGCGNVSIFDMLFWRDWNQTLNNNERLALHLIHANSFKENQDALMSTNVLTATVRCHIELYAGFQRLLYDLILQVTTKLSQKYAHMLPIVTAIQKLGEETLPLDDQCMQSKVVHPTLLSKYAEVRAHNIHLGAVAFDIFLKAHHQTGKMRTMEKFAKILTKSMNLDEGLLAHFQNARREFVEFASTRPFENSGRDETPPVTILIDDSLFIWYYKGAAEDLLNKLSGSELIQFQLFYKEVVELKTVDEIGNLVEQYHSRSCFLPTGRADTYAAGSYGGGPPVKRSHSELVKFGDEVEQALLETGMDDPMIIHKGVKIPKQQIRPAIFNELDAAVKGMIAELRIFGHDALRMQREQRRSDSSGPLPMSESANNNKKIKVSFQQPKSNSSTSSSSSSEQSLAAEELAKKMAQQAQQLKQQQQQINELMKSQKSVKAGTKAVEAITAAASASPAAATPTTPDSSNTKTKGGKGDGKGGGKGGKGGKGDGGKGGKGKGKGKGQNNNWNNNNNQWWFNDWNNGGWGNSGWGSGN